VKMNLTELEALVVEQGRRLALAESDIVALNARLGFRKVTPLAASVPAEPDGVRIVHPIERAKIALPTDEELRKLLGVVFGAYPTLRPWTPGSRFADQDEADFNQQFSAAFTYVAHQGRTEEVDKKRSVGWWADQAADWFRQKKAPTNVGSGAFLAACVAAGDIPFQRSDQYGNTWAVALVTFGGRPATDAWKKVLGGNLRRPLPGVHKPPSGERPSVRVGQSAD
jgi:hypothetical protein